LAVVVLFRVMAERDPFDLVEMSPGAQPPAGFGDRVLVGLALLALLGGGVIAVVNFIPDGDEVAQASIDPSAERSRPPPPTPAPPRVATIEDPDINISPPENWYGFDGWIRASVDLVIHSDRDVGSTEVGVLKLGDVAYASTNGEPDTVLGWLYLQDHSGWVTTKADGQVLARRYEYPQTRGSGSIDSLTAGPDGFLAMITPPQGPPVYAPPRPAVSADGTTWHPAASAFDGQWAGTIAHGPSGWLAAGSVNDGSSERIFLWGSPDGLSWSRLGMLSGVDETYVDQLLGSQYGYLLTTQSGRGAAAFWASADGLTWTQSAGPPLGYGDNGYRRTAAVAGGFYSWGDRATSAFSADGLSWFSAGDGPDGVSLRLADLEGRAFAIDLDRETLAARVWGGIIARGRLGWQRLDQSDHFFANAVVTQLVSDGKYLYAFGWERSTEEPLVWTGDGAEWTRSPLPNAFGGFPLKAAAGRNGIVAIGYRSTLRGDNPIAWHRTAAGGWLPESNPMLAVVQDPAGADCPALPADFLEFSVVDAAGVVACHGDAPITLEGVSVRCEGCAWSADGDPQPAWLMDPYTNVLYMSPVKTDSGWQTTLTLGPSLTLDPAWMDQRLRVTGHYDDPAALTCHQDVNADSVEWWTGQQAIINQCRQTFVVTDVTVLQ
jgi:hypothetical protein